MVLFFQCMSALLSPVNHMKGGVKWALVAHTVAAFLFLTIHLGISLVEAPILYINDREFPGNDEYPPGPIGYNSVLATNAATIVYYVIFPLNQWLADGLLVGRISNPVTQVFNVVGSQGASMLRHLFHESLGHGLPMPDVPRFCWYVFKSSRGCLRHVDQHHWCSDGYRAHLPGIGTRG